LDIFERPLPTTLYPLPAVAIGADNLDVPTWWANPGKAITMDITIVRLDVTALRPEMRRREIREVLRRHPIVLGFVSPDTGGPSSRTKLDIIAEARTTVGLPPLTRQQIGSWTPSTKSSTLMVLPVEIIVPPPGPLLDESDTDGEAPQASAQGVSACAAVDIPARDISVASIIGAALFVMILYSLHARLPSRTVLVSPYSPLPTCLFRLHVRAPLPSLPLLKSRSDTARSIS
jgi:hypothetical protein